MSLNKVMLIGNVGIDPEVRYLEGNGPGGQGTKVATFRLATSERYRDRNGETRENTEWHSIVAWRQNADVVERFVKKGTQLYIEGKLRTRNYTDAAGQKKYVTEIAVDTLQLLGRREDNPGYQQGSYQQSAPQQPAYQQSAPQPSYQSKPAPAPAPAQPAPVKPVAAPEPISLDIDNPADDLPF